MTATTLVLNAGSSSIKFALYRFASTGSSDTPLYHGEIEDIGDAEHTARTRHQGCRRHAFGEYRARRQGDA